MFGWNALPRTIRLAFVIEGALTWLRLMLSFVTDSSLGDHFESIQMGAMFATSTLMIAGSYEMARRTVGGAVGLWIVFGASIAEIAMFGAWYAAQTYAESGAVEDASTIYDKLQLVSLGITVVLAVGWAIASRNVLLGIGVVVLAGLGHETWRLYGWLTSEPGIAGYETIAKLDAFVGLCSLAMTATVASVAAGKAKALIVPRRASAGLHAMAMSLWLRVGVMAVIGLTALAGVIPASGDVFMMKVVLAGHVVAIASAVWFGVGAMQACRVPDAGVPPWWSGVAAALSIATAGVATIDLPYLVNAVLEHRVASYASHSAQPDLLMMSLLSGLSIAVALGALATYTRRCGSPAVAETLVVFLVLAMTLVGVGSLLMWWVPRAQTPHTLLEVLGWGGLCIIGAAVLGAIGMHKAQAVLRATETRMPVARII